MAKASKCEGGRILAHYLRGRWPLLVEFGHTICGYLNADQAEAFLGSNLYLELSFFSWWSDRADTCKNESSPHFPLVMYWKVLFEEVLCSRRKRTSYNTIVHTYMHIPTWFALQHEWTLAQADGMLEN